MSEKCTFKDLTTGLKIIYEEYRVKEILIRTLCAFCAFCALAVVGVFFFAMAQASYLYGLFEMSRKLDEPMFSFAPMLFFNCHTRLCSRAFEMGLVLIPYSLTSAAIGCFIYLFLRTACVKGKEARVKAWLEEQK